MKRVSEGFMRASNFPSRFCREDLQIKDFVAKGDFLNSGIKNTIEAVESKGEIPFTFKNNMFFFGPAKRGKTTSALQYLLKLHGILNCSSDFMYYVKEFDLFEIYKNPHFLTDDENGKKKVLDTQFLVIDNICEIKKSFSSQEFLSFFKYLIASRIDSGKRTLLIYDTFTNDNIGEIFADYFGVSLITLLEEHFQFVKFE